MTKLQEHNRTALTTMRAGGGTRSLLNAEGHRVGQGNTLRAAVFGINDGLVSNVSLVMGVAGQAPTRDLCYLLVYLAYLPVRFPWQQASTYR
jgi:hypothetical protein